MRPWLVAGILLAAMLAGCAAPSAPTLASPSPNEEAGEDAPDKTPASTSTTTESQDEPDEAAPAEESSHESSQETSQENAQENSQETSQESSQDVSPPVKISARLEFPQDKQALAQWSVEGPEGVASGLVIDGAAVPGSWQGPGSHEFAFDVQRGVGVVVKFHAEFQDQEPSITLTATSPVPHLIVTTQVASRSHDALTLDVDVEGAPDVEVRLVWAKGSTPWSADTTLVATGLAPDTEYRLDVEARTSDSSSTAHETVVARTEHLPWASPEEALIYPGAAISMSGGGCTLGFITTSLDNATVYGVTAGHCIWSVGQEFRISKTQEWFGQAVAFNRTEDWGLVKISQEYRGKVTPIVLGMDAPTGIAPTRGAQQGDDVCLSGQANESGTIQNVRCGEFHEWNEPPGGPPDEPIQQTQHLLLRELAGDSGGPIVDDQGRALAILIGGSTGTVSAGTGFEYALGRMADAGFPVELALAPK